MNKKGFTLVELIAVITVITLLFSLATPKLMENYNDKKNKLYDSTIKELERVARMYLTDNPDVYSDISENGYVNISVNTLCNQKYLTCPVKNPKDNSNIDGYINVIYENNKYVYRFSDNEYVNENVLLEVYLNGGNLSNNISGIYKEGDIIELETPIRGNDLFKGWKVVKGNSKINDNKLIIGSTNTIIYAEWENYSDLTINLDGGTVNTNHNGNYKSGTIIELEVPIKEGYTFKGWEVKEGNGILSGNKITIGSDNTTIRANFVPNNYTIQYELNRGKFDSKQPINATYDSVIKINKPSKTGYKFIGWTISGLDKNSARYGSSSNDVSNAINDIALGEYFLNLNSSINGNVTMTANWEFIPDSIVYEHKGEYVFDGTNYIDTGISLFSEEYNDVNFEVSFSILDVNDEQENNAALFNCLNEADAYYPGILFRVANTTKNFLVLGNNKVNNFLQRAETLAFNSVTKVKIVRINNIIYYSINDGDYYELQDFSVFSEYFDVPVTFGASLDENGQPFRYFKGTLSNMKIKFLSENTSINAYSLKYYVKDKTVFDGTNYINTNVYLFNEENIKKDFKIRFTLDSYGDTQEEYATIFNSLDESTENYPGLLFRFKKITSTTTTTQLEIVSNGTEKLSTPFEASEVKTIILTRKNNKLHYSINSEEFIQLFDYSDFTDNFNVPVTIGASVDEEGNAYRYFKGSLSNIEIMLKEDIN